MTLEVFKVLWRFFIRPTSCSAFDVVMLASRTMEKRELESAARYLEASAKLAEKLDAKAAT